MKLHQGPIYATRVGASSTERMVGYMWHPDHHASGAPRPWQEHTLEKWFASNTCTLFFGGFDLCCEPRPSMRFRRFVRRMMGWDDGVLVVPTHCQMYPGDDTSAGPIPPELAAEQDFVLFDITITNAWGTKRYYLSFAWRPTQKKEDEQRLPGGP